MDLKTIWEMLKETFEGWRDDKAPRLAAALAYYTIFSLPPLLIIVIAIAGLVFGQAAVEGEIVGQIEGLVGEQGAQAVQTMIAGAYDPASGILATVISVVVLIFGATGLFGQLQDALNTIWGVALEPGAGVWNTIKKRLLSFGMVLVIAFLLLVSLVLNAALAALAGFLSELLPGSSILLQIVNFAISLAVITFLFALIYKVLPDAEIAWRDVWVGALVTALLFIIGQFLLGLYIGQTATASTYGAAGSLVVLLLWVYYTAQILLFGAEFTQVYARRRGSRIQPAEGAVRLTEEARARQGLRPRGAVPAAGGEGPAAARPGRTVTVWEPAVDRAGGVDVDVVVEGETAAAPGFVIGLAGFVAGLAAALIVRSRRA